MRSTIHTLVKEVYSSGVCLFEEDELHELGDFYVDFLRSRMEDSAFIEYKTGFGIFYSDFNLMARKIQYYIACLQIKFNQDLNEEIIRRWRKRIPHLKDKALKSNFFKKRYKGDFQSLMADKLEKLCNMYYKKNVSYVVPYSLKMFYVLNKCQRLRYLAVDLDGNLDNCIEWFTAKCEYLIRWNKWREVSDMRYYSYGILNNKRRAYIKIGNLIKGKSKYKYLFGHEYHERLVNAYKEYKGVHTRSSSMAFSNRIKAQAHIAAVLLESDPYENYLPGKWDVPLQVRGTNETD